MNDDIPASHSVLAKVSSRGLVVRISGTTEAVPWTAVREILAGRASNVGNWLFMLGFEIHLDGAERVILVSEIDPLWARLTAILPRIFPTIPAFEQWALKLVAAAVPLVLHRALKDLNRPAGRA